MDITLAHHPLILVLALAVALALTIWTYRRSRPQLLGWRKWLVRGLRFGALFIVIFLLFEPILKALQRDEEPPLLALLVDDTQSLSADPEMTDGQDVSEHVRQLVSQLPAENIDRFAFASEVRPLPDNPTDSTTLQFDGDRTNISTALESTQRNLARRNLKGVLLISDGRFNTGRNPLYVAENSRVPIYTVVVGDTTEQRDVVLSGVVTNDVAYANTILPIQAHVRAHEFAGTQATVSVSEQGNVIASQVITLPENGLDERVELSVTPTTPGLHRYTISVSRQTGEASYRNNAETVSVRVLDTQRRILVLAAAPSPDLSALLTSLQSNPNLELDVLTQRDQSTFYEGSFPSDLSVYDLSILVGYPGAAASTEHASELASAISDGLPVAFFLSQQTDLNLLRTTFSEILPVAPEVVRPFFSEGRMVVSPAGSTHPLLDISDSEPETFSALPPLLINESRWAVSLDARVLATVRRGDVALNDPFIVIRTRGSARSVAILGANAWRWANLPEDLSAHDNAYDRFLENIIHWTTTRTDRRQVRVQTTHARFGENEPVAFTGQVYDESLDPISDADLRVTVTAADGTQFPLTLQPIGNGRYSGTAGTYPPGGYTFSARAEQTGSMIGEDDGSFSVGQLALEFRNPGADASLMRQIALRSGGRVVTVDELPNLLDLLREEGRFAATAVEQEETTPLINLPFLLIIAIGLLTAEWFVRKRNGLV
ncbi:MAG: hypothetical protein R3284_02690 [Rubricoccaceae bacterium]|nr:hypothetical protein [Rubricoccaceae bacterium]